MPCPSCGSFDRTIEPLRWWVRSYDAWFDRPWICSRCGCRYHLRGHIAVPKSETPVWIPIAVGVGALVVLLMCALLGIVMYVLEAN